MWYQAERKFMSACFWLNMHVALQTDTTSSPLHSCDGGHNVERLFGKYDKMLIFPYFQKLIQLIMGLIRE